MSLEQRIYDIMMEYSLERATIIVNSEYLKYDRKNVYVQIKKKTKTVKKNPDNLDEEEEQVTLLEFFINSSSKSNVHSITRHKAGTVRKVIPSMLASLEGLMKAPSFAGSLVAKNLNRVDDTSGCSIEVDDEFNIIILKSYLYRAFEGLVKKQNEANENGKRASYQFEFAGQLLSTSEINMMLQQFKQKSYKLYGDLIFKDIFKKIMKKVSFGSKDLYQIQGAFIPVYIDYEKAYNPLRYDPVFKKSRLYRKIFEVGRVRKGQNFVVYYLTHMEICKALNMKYFMRFTPMFLYNFVIGLMHSDNEGSSDGDEEDELPF